MSKKNFVDFRAIRAAVTMEMVLKHYGLFDQMRRSGDNLTGCCPIHKGTNPTQFRASLEKNIWNCFSGGCNAGGNVLDFIARKENVSIHAAALKAVEWFELDPDTAFSSGAAAEPAASPDRSAERPTKRPPPKPAAPPAKETNAGTNPPLSFRLEKLQPDHPYLTERGLTPQTIADFGLGFCAKGMMTGRIAIPIRNPDAEIVAYVGRWPGEPPEGTPKYKLPNGFRKSLELFNLDRARQESGPLVIVEGFFDVMKLHQLGHRKVVALMGSSMSAAQEALIHEHVRPSDQILVMLDEDEAGRSARDDVALRLAWFAFVRIHAFATQGRQPEHLTPDEVAELFT